MDQFIQIQVDRFCITVLRVLNQKDHEKRDNGGVGIDDELPSIGIVKEWAGESPNYDYPDRNRKGPARTERGEDSSRHDGLKFLAALKPLIGSISLTLMQQANLRVDRDQDKQTPTATAAWMDQQLPH